MITKTKLSAVLAAGAIALAVGAAAPSAAQAKSLNGHSLSVSHGKSALTIRYGQRQHLRGPISKSYIRTVKRGPWRITERVTTVKFLRRNAVRTNVVVLKRVWIGQVFRQDHHKSYKGKSNKRRYANRFQHRG